MLISVMNGIPTRSTAAMPWGSWLRTVGPDGVIAEKLVPTQILTYRLPSCQSPEGVDDGHWRGRGDSSTAL